MVSLLIKILVNDYNDIGVERVKPESRTLQIKNGTVTIPAHSVTFISIE